MTVVSTTAFQRAQLEVGGVQVAVLTAGEGEPLVFLHGADTRLDFDFALGWSDRFKVVVPFHPGFGPSGDDPSLGSIHDYVMHYLRLFDALQIGAFHLVGHGLGGWMAATLALEHNRRVQRLVLVAPWGLHVPEHLTQDVFRMEQEQLIERQTEDPVLREQLTPDPQDVEGTVARYRESVSLARVAWERNYDVKLPRWLHRATMPSLLVWGDNDRMVPAAQSEAWARLLPNARVRIIPQRGHLVLHESPEVVTVIGEFLAEP
ncbi:MAG: alpha/beta fold hydrolase [Chloroflexi bacterium]|nr:alpha/beta fold hydrolase [Chloroflexota bacterium]